MSLPADATTFLDRSLGPGWRADPLFGDASVRRYFRVLDASGRSLIFAYYPDTLRGEVDRFLAAYHAVAPHAPVPGVIESSEVGVIQQDVGDVTLLEIAKRDRVRALELYRKAVDLLVDFQRSADRGAGVNPPFDRTKFLEEMAMTSEFYVGQLCGMREAEALQQHFAAIVENIIRHPYVICHRDYHGENIHIINDYAFIIDYQDLRMGPDTYDLASLLRDRGIADLLGRDAENELLERYRERLGADPTIRSRYFETLLQRTIKIIGTFARQAVARGRQHYLDYIPPALRTIEDCVRELPQYGELAELMPKCPEMHPR